jgi:hypothetical protein
VSKLSVGLDVGGATASFARAAGGVAAAGGFGTASAGFGDARKGAGGAAGSSVDAMLTRGASFSTSGGAGAGGGVPLDMYRALAEERTKLMEEREQLSIRLQSNAAMAKSNVNMTRKQLMVRARRGTFVLSIPFNPNFFIDCRTSLLRRIQLWRT